jgi:hypothetical protein
MGEYERKIEGRRVPMGEYERKIEGRRARRVNNDAINPYNTWISETTRFSWN